MKRLFSNNRHKAEVKSKEIFHWYYTVQPLSNYAVGLFIPPEIVEKGSFGPTLLQESMIMHLWDGSYNLAKYLFKYAALMKKEFGVNINIVRLYSSIKTLFEVAMKYPQYPLAVDGRVLYVDSPYNNYKFLVSIAAFRIKIIRGDTNGKNDTNPEERS